MDVNTFKNNLTQKLGIKGLYLQKHAPEIMLVVGLGGMVAAAVMASRATRNLDQILREKEYKLDQINDLTPEDATEAEIQKAKVMTHVEAGLKVAKLYGPAVSIGLLSIASILSSHGIMAQRQTSLMVAYGLLAKGYEAYRERVREELGEEKDLEFHLGLRSKSYTVKETDEEGKTVKVKKTKQVSTGTMPSIYARVYDSSNPQYKNDRMLNAIFVKAQERYLNDELIHYGFVFLNRAYERLGFQPTPEGQLVGWVLRKPDEMEEERRDGYISFGLERTEAGREFLRGENDACWIDPNVDGVVFHLLEG